MSEELKTPYAAEKHDNWYILKNRECLHLIATDSDIIGHELAPIARALNCHDDLVEALGEIVEQYVFYAGENNDSVTLARSALKLAKGGNVE